MKTLPLSPWLLFVFTIALTAAVPAVGFAQDGDSAAENSAEDAADSAEDAAESAGDAAAEAGEAAAEAGSSAAESVEEGAENLGDQTKKLASDAKDKAEDIARQIDESDEAGEIKAGILKPIYALAEALEFSFFHWVAFTIMVTGVVSYALQLVIGKLIVLAKLGFSLTEIFSDALGLAISLFGLVLTTQAAAQNSSFTQSNAAVISATLVGAICGFVFYLWGQSQELSATRGRKVQNRVDKAEGRK
ncbi:hypothetical protein [Stratiformator vulcanicus]|uniref:MraY-like glycosyltransferase n=1 Tax=Stratiformator vulcanicus TaxID=2527980 RepID=A0A517QYY2_9PLAN|nr:hypothetical protein [Stratiformator vulcanicus]QDT36803.1 MraY-like glycosyltransferase [Stratiformator vulcanicus]